MIPRSTLSDPTLHILGHLEPHRSSVWLKIAREDNNDHQKSLVFYPSSESQGRNGVVRNPEEMAVGFYKT